LDDQTPLARHRPERWARQYKGAKDRIAACADVTPEACHASRVGLYITLRDADGAVVRNIPDPFGGTFDASGNFDELLGRGVAPVLDLIDPYGETSLASSEMKALATEVDALLATIPERAQTRTGRTGSTWRAVTRFRVMVGLCGTDDRFTLNFLGD
jgi:hypothetical protein